MVGGASGGGGGWGGGGAGLAGSLRQEFIRVPVEQAFRKAAMLLVVCTTLYQRGVIVFCGQGCPGNPETTRVVGGG